MKRLTFAALLGLAQLVWTLPAAAAIKAPVNDPAEVAPTRGPIVISQPWFTRTESVCLLAAAIATFFGVAALVEAKIAQRQAFEARAFADELRRYVFHDTPREARVANHHYSAETPVRRR